MAVNVIEIERNLGGDIDCYIDGYQVKLGPSLKVRDHSPTGFNVGYGGSGPAQLALAILMEFVPASIASDFHQKFKWEYVAKWQSGQTYRIDVKAWVEEKIKEIRENS